MTSTMGLNVLMQVGKGSVKATIVQIGETKRGTKQDGGQWARTIITITDGDTQEGMTVWGDTLPVVAGSTYILSGLYVKEYNNQKQLNWGKFSKATIVEGQSVMAPAQATPPPPATPPANTQDPAAQNAYLKQRQAEMAEKQKHAPKLKATTIVAIRKRTDLLYAVRQEVEIRLKEYSEAPSAPFIGQCVNLIYADLKDVLEADNNVDK